MTTLHVFHHSVMPFVTYFGVKFVAGGLGTFFGFLNSFVHIFMYSYYLLASLGPKYQKYLWWKKYMTVSVCLLTLKVDDPVHFYPFKVLQVAQFAAILIHSLQFLFIKCNYPKLYVYMILSITAFIMGMFIDFYIKTYRTSANKKEKVFNCSEIQISYTSFITFYCRPTKY